MSNHLNRYIQLLWSKAGLMSISKKDNQQAPDHDELIVSDSQQHCADSSEVDETDSLVPPIERIFDGAKSVEAFREHGDGFVRYYLGT